MQMQGWIGLELEGCVWLKKFWNCVEEWKRREKAFEAGPELYLLAALLTRLFTALAAVASLARMSHLEMNAYWCSPKANPLT